MKIKNFAILALSLAFLVLLCYSIHQRQDRRVETKYDTIRTTLVDTIKFYQPIPKDSIVTRYVTERLQVVDTTRIVVKDSVEVIIPITQKIYQDSSYTAYVSGYKPSLDSIFINQPKEIITITQYSKPKKFSLSVQVGCGATKEGLSPYVGVGVSYNLISF